MATGGGHPGAGSVTQVTAGRTELDVSLQQPSATQQMLDTFWPTHTEKINNIDINQDFKTQELPLARIKKIMRLDEDVKMISAEAPVLFAKAAEIFIAELSLRAWIHTEDNKRRTLQKNDVSQAVAKYDQFDFLIDIVPRDEIKPAKREESGQRTGMMPDQVQYYLQLAQQTQQALQNQPNTQIQANGIQQVITTTQPAAQQSQQANVITLPPKEIKTQVTTLKETIEGEVHISPGNTFNTANTTQTQQPQIIHIQTPAATPQPTATDQQQASDISQATTQVFQQHVDASTGQIINTPLQIEENETGAVKILLPQSKKIHLTQEQLQAIQLQMQGKQPGQAITIQTQPGSQESEQEASQQPQPLFQVPIGGESQQVFITQDSEDSDQPQVIIQKQER